MKTTNAAVPGIDHLWSIRPDALYAMDAAYHAAVAAGNKEAFFFGAPDDDERDLYTLRDDVAVIPVSGVLRKQGFYSFFFGRATGFTALAEAVSAALDDRQARAILLDVDSPGGTVSGTDAFTDIVFAGREQKPVVAFANGQMCSAAYWAGSAADRVIVERTADVGSIGVICVHFDWSKEDEMMGLKRTIIHAGKYKAVGNDAEPLSDRDRGVIQAELDTVYGIFIDTVARNRNVSADTVREQMAEGRVFIGQQAVDVGLADQVGNFQDAFNCARELAATAAPQGVYQPYSSGALSSGKENPMAGKSNPTEGAPKTVEELTAMFPQLAADLRQQGADSIDQAAIRSAAVADEAHRLHGLIGVHFGAEAGAKFQALADTGITPEQYQATAGESTPGLAQAIEEAAQVDAKKQAMLAAITQAGADNPGAGGAGAVDEPDFEALVAAVVEQKKCSRAAALGEVVRTHPDAHAAYLKKVNPVGSA